MKKTIYSFIAIFFILVVLNFILRYFHIISIENSLKIAVKKGEEVGLVFKYNKMKFRGYKFWDIIAELEDPSIYRGDNNNNSEYTFDKINIKSLIFNRDVAINIIGDVNYRTRSVSAKDNEFKISFTGDKPKIIIKLKKILSSTIYSAQKGENPMNLISELEYKVSGYEFIDISNNNQIIYTMGDVLAKLVQKTKGNQEIIDVMFDFGKLHYNKNYRSNLKSVQSYQDIVANLGPMGFKGEICILNDITSDSKDKEPVSKINEEIVKKLHIINHVKDIKVKIILKSLSSYTDLFSIDSKGYVALTKKDIIPYFYISFNIKHLDTLIDTYVELINTMFNNTHNKQNLLFSKINKKQKQELINLLNSLSFIPSHDEAEIVFNHYEGDVVKISNLPLDKFKHMIDMIFNNDQK